MIIEKQQIIKVCSICKNSLSIKLFRFRNKDKKTLFSYCKDCEKEYMKNYRQNNNSLREKKKEHYNINKEKILNKNKEYRENNRAKLLEAKRKQSALYRENNKDKIINYRKIYNKTLSCKVSKKTYKHKRRELENKGNLTHSELLNLEKSKSNCYWCNCKIIGSNYHIDHYMPLSKGGEHTLSNLVVSCPSCNLRKGNKDPIAFAISIGKLL